MQEIEELENSMEGSKYLVKLTINVGDTMERSQVHPICICDTRDQCIEAIRKVITDYDEKNKVNGINTICCNRFTITRSGTIVMWTLSPDIKMPHITPFPMNDSPTNPFSWYWMFSITPLPYINE